MCCLVPQLCPFLCNPMDYSMPGLPVPPHLSKFAQVHVHCISDVLQPSNPLDTFFSSCLQSFQASGTLQESQLFTSGDQKVRASVLVSVLWMSIQGWLPLRLTGLIPLLSKGLRSLLQHHSLKASILWRSPFFIVRLSHSYMTSGKTITLTVQAFVSKAMSPLFHMCLGLS